MGLGPQTLEIIYDGDCPFCRQSAGRRALQAQGHDFDAGMIVLPVLGKKKTDATDG